MFMPKKYIFVCSTCLLLLGCGNTNPTTENNTTNPSTENNTSALTLAITSAHTYYDEQVPVSLQAVLTPNADSVTSYLWSEDETVLGNESTLTKSDFSVGTHTITLVVETTSGKVTQTHQIIIESSYTPQASDFQTKQLTSNDDAIMIDKHNKMMWVNETTLSKKGCLAVQKTEDLPDAKQFCQNLNFAGFSDWHTPSSSELSTFIKNTVSTDTLPGYPNPCPRLLAKDSDYLTVITRYGAEGHTGETTGLTLPLGVRCVRAVTLYADAGENITVKYHDNFTFDASKSFDTDGNIVKYEWLYGTDVLNQDTSTPQYTRNATRSANDYTVKLRVTDSQGHTDEDTVIVHVQ